jgi:hypothetical protein
LVGEQRCLNCNSVLTGEYCAHCGQHVKHHVHSTREMFGELIEDLFHTDHRVWRTLKPLLIRPGWLTQEYLRGKRVSYTPPFRLYIVLSLLFFLTASLPDHHSESDSAPTTTATSPSAVPAGINPEVAAALDAVSARLPEKEREEGRARLYESLKTMPVEQQREVLNRMLNVCSPDSVGEVLPGELQHNERLLGICRSIAADNGREFASAMWHHVPQMMFFFLPLLALSMKVLYLGSRRFYAEHVLFLVHFHAFFFLAVTIRNLTQWLFGWIPGAWADVITGTLTTAVVFYTPWYLYRSLRQVYGQGRFATWSKFILLSGAYFVSLLLTLLGLVIFTALTLG